MIFIHEKKEANSILLKSVLKYLVAVIPSFLIYYFILNFYLLFNYYYK